MVLVWVPLRPVTLVWGSHSENHCFTEQEKVRYSSSKLKVQPNFRVQLISERPLKKDFPFLSVAYTFLYLPLSSQLLHWPSYLLVGLS